MFGYLALIWVQGFLSNVKAWSSLHLWHGKRCHLACLEIERGIKWGGFSGLFVLFCSVILETGRPCILCHDSLSFGGGSSVHGWPLSVVRPRGNDFQRILPSHPLVHLLHLYNCIMTFALHGWSLLFCFQLVWRLHVFLCSYFRYDFLLCKLHVFHLLK